MRRKIAITAIALAVVAALVVVFEIGRRQSWATSEEKTADRSEEQQSEPSQTAPAVAPVDFGPSPTLEPYPSFDVDSSHPTVRFVDPERDDGVRSLVVAGAPGIWPPETMQSDDRGLLYLPKTDVGTLTGEQFRRFELMARSTEGSLAYWETVAFEDEGTSGDGAGAKRVELRRAAPVEVVVRAPDGANPSGANVRLTRGMLGFVTLNKHSGPDGSASFRTIPPGTYVASAQVAEIGRGRTRFRHDGEEVSSVVVELTSDAVSAPSEGLPDSAETSSEPRRVDLRIRGLESEQWRRTQLRWRPEGGRWQLGTLRPGETDGERTWQRRVDVEAVQLEVRTERGSADRRRFSLSPGTNAFAWNVDLQSSYDVYAVDAYGSPVEGALIQVWRGDEKVASKVSRGAEPVTIYLDTGTGSQIFASDPRRGETVRRIEPDASGELTLRLRDPVFSNDFPPGRVRDRAKLGEILGVPVIEDDDAWRVDGTDPDAPGIRAGLQRGDYLVSVREVPEGWSVLYQRDGEVGAVAIGGGE